MAGRPEKSSKHWLFRKNAGKIAKVTKTKFPSPADTVLSHEDHHLLLDFTGKSADIPSASSSSSSPSPSSPPCYNLRPGVRKELLESNEVIITISVRSWNTTSKNQILCNIEGDGPQR